MELQPTQKLFYIETAMGEGFSHLDFEFTNIYESVKNPLVVRFKPNACFQFYYSYNRALSKYHIVYSPGLQKNNDYKDVKKRELVRLFPVEGMMLTIGVVLFIISKLLSYFYLFLPMWIATLAWCFLTGWAIVTL